MKRVVEKLTSAQVVVVELENGDIYVGTVFNVRDDTFELLEVKQFGDIKKIQYNNIKKISLI